MVSQNAIPSKKHMGGTNPFVIREHDDDKISRTKKKTNLSTGLLLFFTKQFVCIPIAIEEATKKLAIILNVHRSILRRCHRCFFNSFRIRWMWMTNACNVLC